MEILVFNGQYDAYFWVLCTEKYFKVRGTTEQVKMTHAAQAMSGRALKWWHWWSPRHPGVCWEMFTTAFLWRFKPDYRVILPIDDEEEEPDQESSQVMQLDGNSQEPSNDDLQAWDEFLLSSEPIEVPPMRTKNLMVATTPPTSDFNGGILNLADATTEKKAITIPECKTDVNCHVSFDFAVKSEAIEEIQLSSQVRPSLLIKETLYFSVTQSSSVFVSPPHKPPDFLYCTVENPPPPPAPPDRSCCVVAWEPRLQNWVSPTLKADIRSEHDDGEEYDGFQISPFPTQMGPTQPNGYKIWASKRCGTQGQSFDTTPGLIGVLRHGGILCCTMPLPPPKPPDTNNTTVVKYGLLIDAQVHAIRGITGAYIQMPLLDLCSKIGDVGIKRLVFDEMPKMIVGCSNSLILGCSNSLFCGSLLAGIVDANELLSYGALAPCYAQNNKHKTALELLGAMPNPAISLLPAKMTPASVISASSLESLFGCCASEFTRTYGYTSTTYLIKLMCGMLNYITSGVQHQNVLQSMVINMLQSYFIVGPQSNSLRNVKRNIGDIKQKLIQQMLIFSGGIGKGKQWDPGGHADMSMAARSSPFKQWDPGKFVPRATTVTIIELHDSHSPQAVTMTLWHHILFFSLKLGVRLASSTHVTSLMASAVILCFEFRYLMIMVIITWRLTNLLVPIDATSIFLNINAWDVMLVREFHAAIRMRKSKEVGSGDFQVARFLVTVVSITSVTIGVVTMILVSNGVTYRYSLKYNHMAISIGSCLCPKQWCHSCGDELSMQYLLSYTCNHEYGSLVVKGNYYPICLKDQLNAESTPWGYFVIFQLLLPCQEGKISKEKYTQFPSRKDTTITDKSGMVDDDALLCKADVNRRLWTHTDIIVLLSRIIEGVAIALAITFISLYICVIAPAGIWDLLLNTLFACSGGMLWAFMTIFNFYSNPDIENLQWRQTVCSNDKLNPCIHNSHFNLEDKVDFYGDGNVMILVEIKGIIAQQIKWLPGGKPGQQVKVVEFVITAIHVDTWTRREVHINEGSHWKRA